MSDATTELIRAMKLARCDGFAIEEIRSRSWASATFAGVQHELTFRLEGEGAEASADELLLDIGEREFDLRGHIVADIALVSRTRASGPRGPLVRICLEALTLEDC